MFIFRFILQDYNFIKIIVFIEVTMSVQHFILCLDKNVTIGAGTLITSVIVNNPSVDCHFHLYAKTKDLEIIQKLLTPRFSKLNLALRAYLWVKFKKQCTIKPLFMLLLNHY